MTKYARLFEITKEMKTEIEDECETYISPLSYNEDYVKVALLSKLELSIEPDKSMISTKVETNGGRTILVMSDEPVEDFVEISYRYEPQPNHVLADYLFYIEDLCVAFDIPRTVYLTQEERTLC